MSTESFDSRIDSLESSVAKLAKSITDMSTAIATIKKEREESSLMEKLTQGNILRKRIPDETTPRGTIITCRGKNYTFYEFKNDRVFSAVYDYSNREYISITNTPVPVDEVFVNTEEDLQFRAFLNVPENYKWFAIDSDGIGVAYTNIPEAIKERGDWVVEDGDEINVGFFDYYSDEWDKILIERKNK